MIKTIKLETNIYKNVFDNITFKLPIIILTKLFFNFWLIILKY